MHNYIDQIAKDTYTNNKENLMSEKFIYGYLVELKLHKLLNIDKRKILKTINFVLDNLELLSGSNAKSFEIILEQMEMYAHKESTILKKVIT